MDQNKNTIYDVFISYSSKNKNITDALCHYLEEQKIRCWMAPRDILPGQEYAGAIEKAMKEVKVFVLVCSGHSLQSHWVHKETNLAVDEAKVIIPFKIENCSLEGTGMKLYLNDKHWIDAVPHPNEAFGNLATAIKSLLIGTTVPSAAPSVQQPPCQQPNTTDGILNSFSGFFSGVSGQAKLARILGCVGIVFAILFTCVGWIMCGIGLGLAIKEKDNKAITINAIGLGLSCVLSILLVIGIMVGE